MIKGVELKNRVRELRLAKNLSQEELAHQTGTTRQTIYSIEKGVFCPTVKLAMLLCMVLDVTFEEMFYFE